MISCNSNLQKFLIKFQKTNIANNDKDILLRFKERTCPKQNSVNSETELDSIICHICIYSDIFFFLVIENRLFLTQLLQLIMPITQYRNNWQCTTVKRLMVF
jgi:hypothetical protein